MASGASKKRAQLNWLKKGYCPSKFCVHSSYGSRDIVFNLHVIKMLSAPVKELSVKLVAAEIIAVQIWCI